MTENNSAAGSESPASVCSTPWCPDRCPITWLSFFMWIEHPTKGMVPTYGGPFDSYTIPEPDLPDDPKAKVLRHEVEFTRERYDHDEGAWVDGCEIVSLRVVSDDHLIDLEDKASNPKLNSLDAGRRGGQPVDVEAPVGPGEDA